MWKNIKNWEQFYEVNEYGEVRNKLNGNIIDAGLCLISHATNSILPWTD